jgi:hypothetical protein
MTKKNLEKQMLMQGLIAFCTTATNQQITNLINAFKNGITGITNIVNQMLAINGAQSSPVGGGGTQKEISRSILDQVTFAIINAAKGYFLFIKDFDTARELSFSTSAIGDISDKNIFSMVTNWKNLITPVLTNLEDWGISQNSIVSWDTAVANYQKAYLLPHNKKVTKSSLTAQTNQLVKDGMTIVKNTLDTSVNSYIELGHQQFVADYKLNRKETGTSTKFTKYRVVIVDDLNQPVFNASILQDGTTNKVFTGINGMATLFVKPVAPVAKGQTPVYSFTVKSGNKEINSGNVAIKKGETVSAQYKLEPSGFIIPAPVETPQNQNA